MVTAMPLLSFTCHLGAGKVFVECSCSLRKGLKIGSK